MSVSSDIETIGHSKVAEITIEIKKLENYGDLPLPKYATSGSAGLDLMSVSSDDIVLRSGQSVLVETGLAIALPVGFEAQVRPRSGLAAKHQITVLNSPGTIDADYRGEIKVILINHGTEDFVISRGMRIAQLVIASVWQPTLVEVTELGKTDRGAGGFGSTGL